MFIFEGRNTRTGKTLKKEFQDESEAVSFGQNSEYDKYKVIDENGENIWSNGHDDDVREGTINDLMGGDEEGNDPFEEDNI